MEMSKKRNSYSGQALAIAMLVLVISSLIGLAMYSRTSKDKTLTLEAVSYTHLDVYKRQKL